MVNIDQHLETLAIAERDARRNALADVLAHEGFCPVVQTGEATEKIPRAAQNYLILPEGAEPFPLFCAHYDCYAGSIGANDNAAAECILIELAKTLRDRGVRAGFAFFDGEEEGHRGAKLFCANRDGLALSAVINLDICGYGDTIVVHSKGNHKKQGIRAFCDSKLLKTHDGQMVKFLPESDAICFRTQHQPVLSVAIVPKWDIKYLDALATYSDSILGKPPEFQYMLGQMEVTTTMHGAFRDGVKWVEPNAMLRVYDYLLDAVTAPPHSKRFWQ